MFAGCGVGPLSGPWAGKMNVEALSGLALHIAAVPVMPAALAAGQIGAAGFLNDEIEVREDYAPTEHFLNLRNRITGTTLYATKYEEWKSLYGKNRYADLDIGVDISSLELSSGTEPPEKIIRHSSGKYWIRIHNHEYGTKSYGDTIDIAIRKISENDPGFPSRLAEVKIGTRKTPILVKGHERNKLNPQSKGVSDEKARETAGGFFFTTCVSEPQAIQRIRLKPFVCPRTCEARYDAVRHRHPPGAGTRRHDRC